MTQPSTPPETVIRLARTIQLDESDRSVFPRPAEPGEWAISGGFEFSNWTEADLDGKARQAFANGWLGLGSFGRATFVAVARIEPAEFEALAEQLAAHFVAVYGAPDLDAALPVAREELAHMAEMCGALDDNTLIAVSRELGPTGVHEAFRTIAPDDARLEQVAVHAAPAPPAPEDGA